MKKTLVCPNPKCRKTHTVTVTGTRPVTQDMGGGPMVLEYTCDACNAAITYTNDYP